MLKKIQTVSAIILIAYIAQSNASTPFRKCSNGKALPLMVQIDNCEHLPCDFFKDTPSNVAIQFVATKNTMNKLQSVVRLSILGIEIPFKLKEDRSDVCKNLLFGAYCPLDAGEDVTYHLIMQVNNQQPEVPIKLEVNLLDRTDNSVVACFITDGRVKENSGMNKNEEKMGNF